MNSERDEPLEAELIFTRTDSSQTSVAFCLAGGIVAISFAAVGFCLALTTGIGQFAMHSITTLPTLLGIGALAAARSLSRTPRQVSIGAKGLSITDRKGQRLYSWADIGWAATGTSTMGFRRQLTIYDPGGKAIASLSDAFDDFESLVEQIDTHIAKKEDPTAQTIQKRKGRKSALITASIALVLSAVSIANMWMAFEEKRAAKLLQDVGIPGEAEVVRRFTAPNGITRRLEYSIAGVDGRTGTRNAEVTPAYWDTLEDAKTVPVIYVREEPEISRLAHGEVDSNDLSDSPGIMIGLSVVLLGLCVVFFAAAAMQWYGWDIDLDTKTGKISIKRFGTGK